jgi:hypothetical protein
MIGGWKKLHDEEFHNLYPSPNINITSKPRKIKWKGIYYAWGENAYRILWESQKERDN